MMYRKAMIIPDAFLVDANNFGYGMGYGKKMFTEELIKTIGDATFWGNSASVRASFDNLLMAASISPDYIPPPINMENAQPEQNPDWPDYDLDKNKIAALLAALIDSESVADEQGVAKPQFEALMVANGIERIETTPPV